MKNWADSAVIEVYSSHLTLWRFDVQTATFILCLNIILFQIQKNKNSRMVFTELD
jgi:hypothetical protein